MLQTVLFLLLSSLALTQGGNPLCQSDHSFLLGILRLADYNDTCVESALSYCSSAQGGCHFIPVVQELQENKEKLQEVRDELQKVKTDTLEGKEIIQQEMQDVKVEVQKAKEMLKQVLLVLIKNESLPRHCKDLLDSGDNKSGLREVYPNPELPNQPVTVFCDQETDGGGWTVFQRRVNNTVRLNFNRNWTEYQTGFGDVNGEFWLGLDHLHNLASATQELRVDLHDYDGQHRWAKYGTFQVGPEDTNYRLTVERYSGDAKDGMAHNNDREFSTHDNDNDSSSRNCAALYGGAWWYGHCTNANLNGYQHVGSYTPSSNVKGIYWEYWRGFSYSLRGTAMMIRPAI